MTTVNLDTRTAKRNGKLIIRHGKPVNGYSVSENPVTFCLLENLYHTYKYSAPDRIRPRHPYFKALGHGELPAAAVVAGANRQRAREKLEMAILEGSINGSLTWPESAGWFWRSQAEPDLVVLRKWVEPDA